MKGVKDFVDWLDGACDLTWKSYSVPRDVSYVCYKPEMQIEKVEILMERCKDKNITVTRGYGQGKICCPTSECVFMQDIKCVYQNELCMENRKLYAEQSPLISKSLKTIYLQYDEFSARARSLEFDVRTLQIKLQRAQLKLNRTVAGLLRAENTLKKLSANQKLLRNQEERIARIVYRDRSTISVEKVEFDIVQYSPQELKRLPLRITLSDFNGDISYLDIAMDETQIDRSIRSIVDAIVDDAISYISIPTQKRRRRSVSSAANVSISEQKHDVAYWSRSCRKFNEAFGLIKSILLKLEESNIAETISPTLQTNNQPFTSPGRTTASLIALQKEFELGTMDTVESDKEVIARWRQVSEDILTENLGAVCGDFDDCVKEQITFLKQLYEPTMDGYQESIQSLDNILTNLQQLSIPNVSNGRVLKIKEMLFNEMRSVESNTYFCDDHPVLTSQMPKLKKAYQGQYFELRCTIDGPAGVRYSWTRNGTILPSQKDWILKIDSVSTEDQGIYVCHGETMTNKVSSNQILVPVRQPIRFKSQPQDHVIRYPGGDQTYMVCNVTSSVELSYKWWYKAYTNNNKQLVSRSSVLHIKSVRSSNIGFYWCEVTDGQIVVTSRKSKIDVVRIVPRKESVRVQLSVASLTKHSQRCQLPSRGSASATIKSLFGEKLRYILPSKVSNSFRIVYQVDSEGQANLYIDLSVGSTVDQATTKETGFALKVAYERSKLKSSINEFVNEMKNNVVSVAMDNCSYVTKKELSVDWLKEQEACPRGMEASKDVVYCGKSVHFFYEYFSTFQTHF